MLLSDSSFLWSNIIPGHTFWCQPKSVNNVQIYLSSSSLADSCSCRKKRKKKEKRISLTHGEQILESHTGHPSGLSYSYHSLICMLTCSFLSCCVFHSFCTILCICLDSSLRNSGQFSLLCSSIFSSATWQLIRSKQKQKNNNNRKLPLHCTTK